MIAQQLNSDAPIISILIADDHEVSRRGFRAILESQPDLRVVDEASDGSEAIEKAKACLPGIVLMDLGMPKLNGMEATRRLREELPNAQVLILTIHFSKELLEEAVHVGARGYLLKTEANNELVNAIRCLCRHQVYFGPE